MPAVHWELDCIDYGSSILNLKQLEDVTTVVPVVLLRWEIICGSSLAQMKRLTAGLLAM